MSHQVHCLSQLAVRTRALLFMFPLVLLGIAGTRLLGALAITTASLPAGEVSVPYNQSLAATGGTLPYTWSVLSGALPPGLTLNAATGVISGTPFLWNTVPFAFTIQVKDALNATASKALSILIYQGLAISTASANAGEVGLPFSQTFAATGGSGGNVWSLAAGALPPGLALSGAGVLSGTPSAPGSYSFTLKVTDLLGGAPTKAFTQSIASALTIATVSLPDGEVGIAYNQTLNYSGGYGTRTWTALSGLPAGLSLSATAALTGTPAAAGPVSLQVRVTDSLGATATVTFPFTIYPALAITTASLPGGTVGLAYSQTLQSTGGGPAKIWSLSAGAPPSGISLSSAGVLSGTPNRGGAVNFTVLLSDGIGSVTASLSMALTQPLALLNSGLSDGYLGIPYPAQVLQAAGGSPPYAYALISGTPPAGILWDSTGHQLTGTPAAIGIASLTFRVTDSLSAFADRVFTLAITPAPLSAQWTPRGFSGGEYAFTAVSPSYAADATLFLPGTGELFRSADRGVNWIRLPVNPSGKYLPVRQILLSPSYDQTSTATPEAQTLFARTDHGANDPHSVWKSTDHGATFASMDAGLVNNVNFSLLALGISPGYAADHTLWGVVFDGLNLEVFRSSDGAATWNYLTYIAGAEYGTHQFAISPGYANDSTIYLMRASSIWRSRDRGNSWSRVYLQSSSSLSLSGLAISPAFPSDHALALWQSDDTLLRSLDAGDTFTLLAQRGAQPQFAARAGLPPLLYAWNEQYSPPPYNYTGDYRFAVSADYGDIFTGILGNGLTNYIYYTRSLSVSPPLPGGHTDLFTTTSYGLFASFDDGQSFAESDRGVGAISLTGIAGTGSDLVAGGGTVWFRSSDGGGNWVSRGWPWIYGTDRVVISPDFANDKTLFIGNSQWMSRSGDGGATFPAVTLGGSSSYGGVYSLAIQPGFAAGNGTVYMGGSFSGGTGWARSLDGGRTFSSLPVPAPCSTAANSPVISIAYSANFPADQTLFIGGRTLPPSGNPSGFLCKSVNNGATWTLLNQVTAPSVTGDLVALSPSYNESGLNGSPAKTLIFYHDGVFYRSTDGGATALTTGGLAYTWPGPQALTISFSPNFSADGAVFITANEDWPNAGTTGVWRSLDFGANFSRAGALDLGQRPVAGLFATPDFNATLPAGRLLAATAGSGLWASADGGATFSPSSGYRLLSNQITGLARSPGGVQGIAQAVKAGSLFAATADQGIFQSDDNGATFSAISAGLPANASTQAVVVPAAAQTAPVTAVLDAANAANQGLYRYNGASWSKLSALGSGNYGSFLEDGTYLYATRADGVSVKSTDGGANWTTLQGTETDLVKMDFNSQTTPTFLSDPAAKTMGPGANIVSAVTASLWAVSQASGPRYSLNSGSSWTATPGTNDYPLPSGQTWSVIRALGINPASGSRELIAGSTTGLYRSIDGGATWKSVSGSGSGLEATSKNFSATISSVTASGTTDLLVGATGATNGGVYLSGDGGEHWTQVNQGFDPANLSISSLITTSCSGCPVQYYSGSYGGGMYTRTIAVVAPPSFPSVNYSCYTGTSCACVTGGGSGPEQGGQAFTLCGGNFQSGAVAEFDGVPATGCTVTATSIGCTSTPPHAPGLVSIRVRNTDTRVGYLPAQYTYTTGTPRANNLYVAKAAGNANLSWNCPAASCTASAPARVYRSQNAIFSLFVENYNGGASSAGGTGAFINTGAVSSAQSYFWSVE